MVGSASPRPAATVFVLAVFLLGVTFIVWSLVVSQEASLHTRIVMGVGIGLVFAAIVALVEYIGYRRFMR